MKAWTDDSYDDAIKTDDKGMDQVGDDVGTPTIAFGGLRFLRPGADRDPRGEAGLDRDACVTLANAPLVLRVSGTRNGDLDFS